MTNTGPAYVSPYLKNLNPNEIHNAGGSCINPKCDYQFTPDDKDSIAAFDGVFTCPKCDRTYDYYYASENGGFTHAGITMRQMGQIGEKIIARMGSIPLVGEITWQSQDYFSPLDFIIGPYGVEVKTNHSEATPRFKLGGAFERQQKIKMVQDLELKPGFLGVRLNFYTDKADIFFRPQFTDTWIGNPEMPHVAKVDFTEFNPYKTPSEVPPGNRLPDDDSTPAIGDDSDIPF